MDRINPIGVFDPKGYSHVVKAGNQLFISGQVAIDSKKNIVGLKDPEAQTKQIFKNIYQCLSSQGVGLESIAKINIYVTSPEYISSFRKVRNNYFSAGQEPAATLVVVSQLASPELLIEIDAIAILPQSI